MLDFKTFSTRDAEAKYINDYFKSGFNATVSEDKIASNITYIHTENNNEYYMVLWKKDYKILYHNLFPSVFVQGRIIFR
jgi:hypothetical protein